MDNIPNVIKEEKSRNICGNNLLIPGFSRELPISKQQSPNFTICTIAPDNVIRFKRNLSFRSFGSDTSGGFVLFKSDDFVTPFDISGRAFENMIVNNSSKLIQWQANRSQRVILN